MNTDNYIAWQALIDQRNISLYWLALLALLLVGSYLLTYAAWLPYKYGKLIRIAYEAGGILLYIGIIVVTVTAKG